MQMYLKSVLAHLLLWLNLVSSVKISDSIGNNIESFAIKGLGTTSFEEYLRSNNITYTNTTTDLNSASQLAASIHDKLVKFEDILKNDIKNDVKGIYRAKEATTAPKNCKNIVSSEAHPVLGLNVDRDEWCITGDVIEPEPDNLFQYMSVDSVLSKWKAILSENTALKRIKIGTEQGILYTYPAQQYRIPNDGYDPRFRQWYVETVTSQPKDLVLMIDKSQSMSNEKVPGSGLPVISLAIRAARTVVDTLNHNDRIGVLSFGKTVNTPTSRPCYSEQLSKVTDVTKQDMKDFLDNIQAVDTTISYVKALRKAFSLLNNTQNDTFDSRRRERIILFLTDGGSQEDDSTILNELKWLSGNLNNTVSLLTFGVGAVIEPKSKQLLEQMAQQNYTIGGDIPRFHFTLIEDPDNLRYKLSSYYDYFIRGSVNEVQFSVPYNDVFGNGTQISMCLPFNYQDKLAGVLCVDVALDYLLSDITYFRDDDGSYAFIVDSQSRVLSHPLLPNLADQSTDFFFAYLPTVEIGDNSDITFIRLNMTRGGSYYKKPGSVARIIPTGSGTGQNVYITKNLETTYYWYPVKETYFSVAIVTKKASKSHIKWTKSSRPAVWYHTDHKTAPRDTLCRSFNRSTPQDRAAVFLSIRSFQDSYSYTYYNNNIPSNKIRQFLSGTGANPGIKNYIRDTVSAIYILEDIWKTANYSDNIIWRYFATRSGILMTYPGIEMPKVFDPTIRRWFIGAVAEDSLHHVSTPYLDAWGAGIVITLSKCIMAKSGQQSFVLGVSGMDFTITSFYHSILENIDGSLCSGGNKCMFIDSAGFIIVHQEWISLEKSLTEEDVSNIHLVEKEPLVAESLIRNNIMQKQYCVDLAQSYKELNYWRIFPNNDHKTITSGEVDFDFIRITQTNMYLIVKKRSSGSISSCKCTEPDAKCASSTNCTCPCTREGTAYDHCAAILQPGKGQDITHPPCAPRIPVLNYRDMLNSEMRRIEELNLQQCHCRSTLHERTNSCEVIEESSGNPSALASWAISIIVLFIIAATVLTVLFVFCMIIRSRNNHPNVIPDEIYQQYPKQGNHNPTFQMDGNDMYDTIPAETLLQQKQQFSPPVGQLMNQTSFSSQTSSTANILAFMQVPMPESTTEIHGTKSPVEDVKGRNLVDLPSRPDMQAPTSQGAMNDNARSLQERQQQSQKHNDSVDMHTKAGSSLELSAQNPSTSEGYSFNNNLYPEGLSAKPIPDNHLQAQPSFSSREAIEASDLPDQEASFVQPSEEQEGDHYLTASIPRNSRATDVNAMVSTPGITDTENTQSVVGSEFSSSSDYLHTGQVERSSDIRVGLPPPPPPCRKQTIILDEYI